MMRSRRGREYIAVGVQILQPHCNRADIPNRWFHGTQTSIGRQYARSRCGAPSSYHRFKQESTQDCREVLSCQHGRV